MTLEHVMAIGLKILAVGVLVFLNGFFVAAEFALVKLRGTQLTSLISAGNRRALKAKHIIGHIDAYLSAAQLGITLASLGLGWIGEPIFEELLHPLFEWLEVTSTTVRSTVSFAVGFTVITFLHIVVGEQAPKSFAIKKPLPMSLLVSYPLHWFYLAAFPFIWVLNQSSLWLLRKLGIELTSEHETSHSEEEIRLLIEGSHAPTEGRDLGRELVLNALDLRDRVAREVMRPRQEIKVLNTADSIEQCLDIVLKNRFSRYPLCVEGDINRTIGVVHIKDMLARRTRIKTGGGLAPAARKLIFVPASVRLEKLLELFIERKHHMAIVVDEFGGTEGLVTLENVLEELVGQIQDEFDQESPLVTQIHESEWEIDGAFPVHELEEMIDFEVAEEDVSTTSGLVTHRLGGFPKVGDFIMLNRFQLTVVSLDGPTVDILKLCRLPDEEVSESAAPDAH